MRHISKIVVYYINKWTNESSLQMNSAFSENIAPSSLTLLLQVRTDLLCSSLSFQRQFILGPKWCSMYWTLNTIFLLTLPKCRKSECALWREVCRIFGSSWSTSHVKFSCVQVTMTLPFFGTWYCNHRNGNWKMFEGFTYSWEFGPKATVTIITLNNGCKPTLTASMERRSRQAGGQWKSNNNNS